MTSRQRVRASHRLLLIVRDRDGFTLAELLVTTIVLAMIMAATLATLDVSQKSFTRASTAEDVQATMRAAMDRIQNDFRQIGSFYVGAGNAGSAITAFSSTGMTFWGDVNADTTSVQMSGATATVAEATLAAAVSSGATGFTVTPAVAGTPGDTGFTSHEMVYVGNGSVREVQTISSAPATGSTVTVSSGLLNGYPTGSLLRSVEQVSYAYTAGTGGNLGTLTRTTASDGTQTLLDNVVSFSMTAYDCSGAVTTNTAAIEEIQLDVTTRSTTASASGGTTRRMTLYVRLRVVPTS